MLRTKKRILDLVFIMTFKQSVKCEEKGGRKKDSKWRQTRKERKEPEFGSSRFGSKTEPAEKKLKM